jgi:uncharacterized protein
MNNSQVSMALKIATKMQLPVTQVNNLVQLLESGESIAFILRYKKGVLNGLNGGQLQEIQSQLRKLREIDEFKQFIFKSIDEQKKITKELSDAIFAADCKSYLEDLYLPYRPNRKAKAAFAKEKGLLPLAFAILNDKDLSSPDCDQEGDLLSKNANLFINADCGVNDKNIALSGAKAILTELFSEDRDLLKELREYFWLNSTLTSSKSNCNKFNMSTYSAYFNYSSKISQIPIDKLTVLLSGRADNSLKLFINLMEDKTFGVNAILNFFNIKPMVHKSYEYLKEIAEQVWKSKLEPELEAGTFKRLRELSDNNIAKFWSKKFKAMLLVKPLGHLVTMGIEPAGRSLARVVVVSGAGFVLDYCTIFLSGSQAEWHNSMLHVAKLIAKYQIKLVSIGNIYGFRDIERLFSELEKMYPDINFKKVIVNALGSAKCLDSTLNSNFLRAISIARRLQNPLLELCNIDFTTICENNDQNYPINKSVIVPVLEDVVAECVNKVGVDVNRATKELLRRVSGINYEIADNIVAYREKHGLYKNRQDLKNVSGVTDKVFEQAAGFLKISNGDNPLDKSTIHPNTYAIVDNIARNTKLTTTQLIGNTEVLKALDLTQYVTKDYDLYVVQDILLELENLGRNFNQNSHDSRNKKHEKVKTPALKPQKKPYKAEPQKQLHNKTIFNTAMADALSKLKIAE